MNFLTVRPIASDPGVTQTAHGGILRTGLRLTLALVLLTGLVYAGDYLAVRGRLTCARLL